MKRRFKDEELVTLLNAAAHATRTDIYDDIIREMGVRNEACVTWLLTTASPKFWAKAHFSGSRYGQMTSNIAESLNAWLLKAREQPLVPMLETIRENLSNWFVKRKEKASNMNIDSLVPNIEEVITRFRSKQSAFTVRNVCSHDEFGKVLEVSFSQQGTSCRVPVYTDMKKCGCRKWEDLGYPCIHAVAALLFVEGGNPYNEAESFYRVAEY